MQQAERCENPALAPWRGLLRIERTDAKEENHREEQPDDLRSRRESKPGNR
jgi:hypothetical protein